jgi:hypothetical protein
MVNRARAGGAADVAAYATGLAAAVADVVKQQREVGIDIPNDGEFGPPRGVKNGWVPPDDDAAALRTYFS